MCTQVIFVHRHFLFWLLFITTIELKQYFIDHNPIQDFSSLLCKIQGLEFGPIKFKAFQDFQGPVRTLYNLRFHCRVYFILMANIWVLR